MLLSKVLATVCFGRKNYLLQKHSPKSEYDSHIAFVKPA
jgi:hypothetical protein